MAAPCLGSPNMDHAFLSSFSFSASTDSMYSFSVTHFLKYTHNLLCFYLYTFVKLTGLKSLQWIKRHSISSRYTGAVQQKNINLTCQMFGSLLGG